MPTTLALTEGADLDLQGGLGPRLVSGVDAAQTFVTAVFASHEGEWGYNLEWGIPYNALLGRYFDDTAAIGILAFKVGGAPGVAPVPTMAVTFTFDPDTRTRTATISPVRLFTGESFDFEAIT